MYIFKTMVYGGVKKYEFGEKNKLEFVEKEKLEAVCDIDIAKKVLKKLRDMGIRNWKQKNQS